MALPNCKRIVRSKDGRQCQPLDRLNVQLDFTTYTIILADRGSSQFLLCDRIISILAIGKSAVAPINIVNRSTLHQLGYGSMRFLGVPIHHVQVYIGMNPLVYGVIVIGTDINPLVVSVLKKRFRAIISQVEVTFQFVSSSTQRQRMAMV